MSFNCKNLSPATSQMPFKLGLEPVVIAILSRDILCPRYCRILIKRITIKSPKINRPKLVSYFQFLQCFTSCFQKSFECQVCLFTIAVNDSILEFVAKAIRFFEVN